MHSRPPGVSPLTLVLPHPQLPRRSSHLSLKSNDSAPRTPSCGSPVTSTIFCPPSRRSTDSWNSSNADELEWEWKPDQVLLLTRTLDALPAHLVTPFNGPIPPANLLDKIARGVSEAKGPVEWPHSLRATRVKLIELSRLKAKEEAQAEQRRNTIAEESEVEIAEAEDDSNYSYVHDNIERPLGLSGRRPLYRQSSMDFLDPTGAELKNTPRIAQLSKRLQRSDRLFSPYARRSLQGQRRSTSPPPLKNMPSLISPSTQSSETLDSLDSFSDSGAKRRSVASMGSSNMSIISDRSTGVIPVPRVQRIRSESVSMAAPPLPPKDRVKPTSNLKRAPSYGAVAQEARLVHKASPDGRERRDSGSYPSSDEEEKRRTKQAKKQRTKTPPTPSKAASSAAREVATPPPVPEKDRTYIRGRGKATSSVQDENVQSPAPVSSPKTKKSSALDGSKKAGMKRPSGMNLQRNTSMFGPELPKPAKPPVQEIPASPVRPRGGLMGLLSSSKRPRSPSPVVAPLSPLSLSPSAAIVPDTPLSPSPKLKTLRRVKRLGPGRRISFGSLMSGMDDGNSNVEDDQRSCLGSAFQLV